MNQGKGTDHLIHSHLLSVDTHSMTRAPMST